jgi:hypothetical protein
VVVTQKGLITATESSAAISERPTYQRYYRRY